MTDPAETDPAELIGKAQTYTDLAERALKGRPEVDDIRDAIAEARTELAAARAGLRALAAEARDAASRLG